MMRRASRLLGYKGYLGVINEIDSVNLEPSLERLKRIRDQDYGSWTVTTTTNRNLDILHDPHVNKGTAFTTEERERLGLRGLLPPKLSTIEGQVQRVQSTFRTLSTGIEKYDFAMEVFERNETLFYRWIMDNVAELAPVIYTPTVGEACLRYGRLYKRSQGMFFSPEDQTHFLSMIHNWPHDDVEVIVVTDGGRILGLGDLGAHGMPIPIGKLALYTAIGGIHPLRTLPIMLDVGTNNEELRNSPTYFGWPHRRLAGDEYYLMVDELMRAIKRRWPTALVQFEDFTSSQAPVVLDAYKERTRCFNDDIQGTGAVVVAGLINALRLQKKNVKELAQTKLVIAGGGSAGFGVALALRDAMVFEGATQEEAAANIYIVDVVGPLTRDRAGKGPLAFAAKDLANDPYNVQVGDTLVDVIRKVRPHGLIGLTGCPGVFKENAVTAMAEFNEQPIVFPLSNPTSRAECTFEQAMTWTDGRCIFGSGSPFAPYTHKGRTYTPSQTNNMYIFPGVGLGIVLSGAKRVTDEMFHSSAKALAFSVSEETLLKTRCLFPGVHMAREVSPKIALAVMETAAKSKLATKGRENVTENWIKRMMYVPRYGPIVPQHRDESSIQS
eukprot:PhF_6_TR4455/c0_g1_i1/m.6042/K00029/E1.1.1.40, maeB; malate dehydrogenase (oxaloacetate-decarboxylating)(NADP+)